jgi:ferrous iron transport protein B
MGIALITSFAAREVFVGTMATIYSVEADEDNFDTVRQHMHNDTYADGTPVYTLATGLSLLVFFAFAMQCMSTLAIVRRETQTWKWAMVQLGYMTALAYVASFVTYQLLA